MGKPLNELELRSMLCSYLAHVPFFTVKSGLISDLLCGKYISN